MLTGLPAAAVAQDPEPTSPEGVDWALTGYLDDLTAELTPVPFGVEASLRLDEGIAAGSGGCNQFSGAYTIDGSSLRFGDQLTVTLALCEDQVQAVEDAYLPLLSDVEGWFIDAGTLQLSDGIGDVILTFEVPHILWTTSQMTGLMATLEGLRTDVDTLGGEIVALRDEVDALNVERLRERVKTLESDNKAILKRLETLEDSPAVDPTPGPGGSASFSGPEKTLLKGIPARIANYCSPLRSSLPKATKAAVTCTPKTSVVGSVIYYLLEGNAAATAFATTMDTFNVPEAVATDQTCEQGVKSQRQWVGNGWQADGCYRTNSRAELRFIDNATACKKLKVGGKTMASPTVYIALQGTTNDVAAVYAWATKNLDQGSGQLTGITQPIPSNLGTSPSCPT
jgi:hypothetical protein